MKLTVERLPESRALLDITADDAEFEQAMNKAYKEVSKQIVVPGFRKGKAPRNIIERQYGRTIFLEEAHRTLMDDLYRKALAEAAFTPVGDPHVEITEIEPLAFKVTVPIYPTVDPGDYADIRVEPVDAAVTDEAVEETIERLRRNSSPWVEPVSEGLETGPDLVLTPKVRLPKTGDQVTIDYAVYETDPEAVETEEDAEFVLGESGLLARLEEEIQKLQVGETAQFAAEYADDDEVVDAGLRGKTMHYTVTLKGIKVRELLPLDDEFAKTHGNADSVEAMRERVRESLHQERTSSARNEVINTVLNAIVEGSDIDLPAEMIDDAVNEDLQGMTRQLSQRGLSMEAYQRMTGQDLDAIKTELRPAATRRITQSLILREIANRENVAIDEADLDASIERMAAGSGAARDPEAALNFFRSDYVRETMRNEMFNRKLQERLIEIGTEGRGAVLNGWVAPEPEPAADPDEHSAVAPEADGADAANLVVNEADSEPVGTDPVEEQVAETGDADTEGALSGGAVADAVATEDVDSEARDAEITPAR